jgi:hypothetical protein
MFWVKHYEVVLIMIDVGNFCLDVGIDGVPLFKHSKVSMYPIVGVILNLPPHLRTKKENMLLLGLIVCKHKPNMNMFLEKFSAQFSMYADKGI